ncbi:ecdysone-induced protein 75B isoform X3 [Brevipalpus obovatus]|uniref:ecdysone-induced protein 75B isoform X3 n=1 Tax=Brevipalpus obovatus TaxID=246614 RepID=UPI003D9DF534
MDGHRYSTAVRFGRVPKREKAKILAAMQKVNQNSQEKQLTEQLEDESRLLVNIVQAHGETCDYTKEKVAALIEKARKQPVYAQCPMQMACPLNPLPQNMMEGSEGMVEDFSERFSPAIRGVVEFAKRIPGFGMLSQDDQVTLLKAGVFEVLLVRLACMFDKQTNSMICLNGMVLKRDSLHSQSSARFLLDSMFGFAEMLNALNLTDHEVALFSAVVVISPDRPGLRNTDLVQKIHRKLDDLLQKAIISNHSDNPGLFTELKKKIPDLRTLNTLHSEKLLAFKMSPQNQQQNHLQHQNQSNAINTTTPVNSTSSSSSSTSSHHSPMNGSTSGSTMSPSSAGDRGSPASMCSYASLLPAQWQNFTINEGPASSRSCLSEGNSPAGTPCDWNESRCDDNDVPFGSPRSYGSNVTSSDNVYNAKSPPRSSSVSSAKSISYNNSDIGRYSPPTSESHHHHSSSNSPCSVAANQFILGKRLLHHHSNSHHLVGSSPSNGRMCPMSSSTGDSTNKCDSRLQICAGEDGYYSRTNSSPPPSSIIKKNLNNNSHSNNNNSNNNNNNSNANGLNGSESNYIKMRRVDSPTDSGIESGKEQCNGSTPTTSVCSSPRSAMDDKVKDVVSDSEDRETGKQETIDDMPMLKRALQAPPLINTNMLMDEAYRHHKKFRATKRDYEPTSSSSSIIVTSVAPSPLNGGLSHSSKNGVCNSTSNRSSDDHHHPHHHHSSSMSPSSSSSTLHSQHQSHHHFTPHHFNPHQSNHHASDNNMSCESDSLASSHSTLVKVLEQAPRFVGEQPLKRTDLIHNIIMKTEPMPPPLDLSRKRDLLFL